MHIKRLKKESTKCAPLPQKTSKRVGSCTMAFALAVSMMNTAIAYEPSVEVAQNPASDAVRLADDGLKKALAALPDIVKETLKRSGVPGAAVAVVHNGKTVFAEGFGLRKVGRPEPVDPSTVFQIASISKPLTASVIAVEVTKNKVSWDDPVARYLPALKLSDPYVTTHATIGDFMAHRTGLPQAAGDDLEDLGYGREKIIKRLKHVPLDSFRHSYHYANFGTTIAAEAVAAAANLPWEALAEQSLFKPLGMNDTSMRHADYLAHPNHATLHAFENEAFQPLFERNPDAQAPAGGVSSNVLDLATWLKFLLAQGQHQGASLAAPDALLDAMTARSLTNQASTPSARSGFYGYGFNVGVNANGRTAFGHSGAFILGASTAFQIMPSADLGIVVLTNGAPVGVPESINATFMDIVQFGQPLRDWYAGFHANMMGFYAPEGDLADKPQPTNPQPSHPLDIYVGHYQNAYFGPAEITLKDNKLELNIGPSTQPLTMTHWDADTFAVQPRSENAPAGSHSSVKFTVKDKEAEKFIVNYLDRHDLATWQRERSR